MPFIKQFPAAQAFEMKSASKQLPNTMNERGGLALSNVQIEFQVTEQPLYLLVTEPGMMAVFLRKWNPEPWFNHGVVTMALPSSLSGTADECDLYKNAQSLDFCTVNLYKPEPLCETSPQQRQASESTQAGTHLMTECYKHAHAHTDAQRTKTLHPFSVTLSAVCFPAFTFLFLWSREVPGLGAVSTRYLNSLALLHHRLGRNWQWEWKLHTCENCQESLRLCTHHWITTKHTYWEKSVRNRQPWFPPRVKPGKAFLLDSVSNVWRGHGEGRGHRASRQWW